MTVVFERLRGEKMQKNILPIALIGIFLVIQDCRASTITLDEFLAEITDPGVKSNDVTEKMKTLDSETARALCDEIMGRTSGDPNAFYAKATNAGVGTIKRSKVVNFCSSIELIEEDFRKPAQKKRQDDPEIEIVKLRPVKFSKDNDVSAQENQIDDALNIVMANADALGKRAEIEVRMEMILKRQEMAREHYNNLQVAIMILRDDLNDFVGTLRNPIPKIVQYVDEIREFNETHLNSTPEQFLEDFNNLSQQAKNLLGRQYTDQIAAARNVLHEVNQNLQNARNELIAINEEMIQLTK
jgi:hypothetical protein